MILKKHKEYEERYIEDERIFFFIYCFLNFRKKMKFLKNFEGLINFF